jgi:hypothetical protein
MLRTDADDIGDVDLFITHAKKGKRGDYRRAGDVAAVPLAFCALRFSSFFLALMRCLRHATLFVLFILLFPSFILLFFALDAAFEIDLGHFLGFVAAIIVFVLVAHVFFIFTVVA